MEEKLIELAKFLGIPLEVTINPDGSAWIGFADETLRMASRRKSELLVPSPVNGGTLEEAYAQFVASIDGRRLCWHGNDLEDSREIVAVIPEALA